jgi:hypothetical protein
LLRLDQRGYCYINHHPRCLKRFLVYRGSLSKFLESLNHIFLLFKVLLNVSLSQRECYIAALLGSSEDIVIKDSFLSIPVGEVELTDAVLSAVFPLTIIDSSISPVHFTVTMSLVVEVVSFVPVATLPVELTEAVFLVIEVLSDILI